MSVLWVVSPLHSEAQIWLRSRGVDYAEAPSRLPTGSEIKEALGSLNDCKVEIDDGGVGGEWHAHISRSSAEWTRLTISNYSGDALPQQLCFWRGDEPLIVEVLRRLSAHCGPLVLIPDTGDDPTVVAS